MQKYRQQRARNACTWCHQQRVRCDISRTGPPCTRCSQDGEGCEIWRKDSKKERSDRKDRLRMARFEGSNPSIASDSNEADGYSTLLARSTIVPLENQNAALDKSSHTEKEMRLYGHVHFSEYSFLQLSSSAGLGTEDMNYLATKGCLQVPAQPALDDLVRMYFMHVHPYSPILDEASFWRSYRRGPSSDERPMSLFVFQALLFVCCTYVELDIVRKCGFPSKLAARNEFYTRAKLLLDLGGEYQELDKARGALLLSYQASSDNPQIGSLMLGAAIQNCTIADKTASTSHVAMKNPLIKRVWWSIVLRDGFISLAFRRNTQINWSDLNLKARFLDESDLEDEIENSEVYDGTVKRFLIKMFERQCQLAVIVIEMMSAFFPQQDRCSYESIDDITRAMKEIEDVKDALSFWERTSYEILSPRQHAWPYAVTNFTNMTRAYYFTAEIHLIHCEAFILESNRSIATDDVIMRMRDSARNLKVAVTEVHRVLAYMSDSRNKETIPLSMLALMAWPLTMAAIDVNLAQTTEDNIRRTQQMTCLGEIYQYLTGVADVTSFVTAGAKQILLLANMAVQQLLIRGKMARPPSALTNRIRDGSPLEWERSLEGDQKNDLRDWVDIFNQYPEVYLLISKSTDYALSCGRLPDQDKLPECLRSANSFGAMDLRLPWLNGLTIDEGIRNRQPISRNELSTEQLQSFQNALSEKSLPIPFKGVLNFRSSVMGDEGFQSGDSPRELHGLLNTIEECLPSDFLAPTVPESRYFKSIDNPSHSTQSQKNSLSPREANSSEVFQTSLFDPDYWGGFGQLDLRGAYLEPELWSSF